MMMRNEMKRNIKRIKIKRENGGWDFKHTKRRWKERNEEAAAQLAWVDARW